MPSYILWGAAGASLIVGASFGVSALNAKKDFDDNPTSAGADRVHSKAVIADVGIGLGALLAVTGGIFFFTADSAGESSTSALDHAAKPTSARGGAVAHMRVAPLITPNGGGGVVSMRF